MPQGQDRETNRGSLGKPQSKIKDLGDVTTVHTGVPTRTRPPSAGLLRGWLQLGELDAADYCPVCRVETDYDGVAKNVVSISSAV